MIIRFAFYFLIIGAMLLVTGCTPAPKIVPVIEYHTAVIAPPEHMTAMVTTPAPDFTPESYALAVPSKREELLDQLIEKLYLTVDTANVKLSGIRDWVERQEKLYDNKPKNGVKNE